MLVTLPTVVARAASDGGRHRWTLPLSVPTTRNGLSLTGLNAPQVTPTRAGVISRAISLPRPPGLGVVHTCNVPFSSPSPAKSGRSR